MPFHLRKQKKRCALKWPSLVSKYNPKSWLAWFYIMFPSETGPYTDTPLLQGKKSFMGLTTGANLIHIYTLSL